MFISKLNQMFERHGRKTFAVITGIIIVTFVLYFSPGFDFFGLLSHKSKVSSILEGTNISRDEINKQTDYVVLQSMLKFPGLSMENSDYRQYAYSQALQNIFLLRAAAKKGINVDDKAVADAQRDVQAFKKDGKFSMAEYERFVKEKLEPYGLSKQDLDNAVRNELILKKLEEEIKSAVVTTPSEIRTAYDVAKEIIKVKSFVFDKKDYLNEVTVDDESLQTFFNTKKDDYKIAPKSKAHVFKFDYANFEEEAKKSITDDEVQSHYDKTKYRYRENNEVQPLDKVREKVVKDLAEKKAKDMAMDKAHAFAKEAYDNFEKLSDNSAALAAIKKLADEQGIYHADTNLFGSDETTIENFGGEPTLVKEISKLYLDSPVSDAVKGFKSAFVAFLLERVDERPAELSEVKSKVEEDFKNEKAALRAREKAREAALSITKALADGKTFEEASKDIKNEDIKEFTADSSAPGRNGSLIADLARKTNKGAISEVNDLPDGALFVFVENKSVPTEDDFKKDEATFSKQYKDEKENAAYQEYINTILKEYTEKKKEKDKEKEKKSENKGKK